MSGKWNWVIGLLLLTLNPGSAVDEQRLNYGVIFQSLSPVYCSADKWIHTFQIQLHDNISVDPIKYCTKGVKCTYRNSLLQQLNAIRLTMNAQFNDTI
ncbi:hypothetical protein ACJMK2_021640 [Sinanodonta woodiana]|uniref:Uncharacterized protein n=1 Tax=Sinanodonta woodiana TaxID=1069815 RepID=A0ABD3TI96_SINWO